MSLLMQVLEHREQDVSTKNRECWCLLMYCCRDGYTDAQIMAVSARYDVDASRGVSRAELRKMQADLDRQKVRRQCQTSDCHVFCVFFSKLAPACLSSGVRVSFWCTWSLWVGLSEAVELIAWRDSSLKWLVLRGTWCECLLAQSLCCNLHMLTYMLQNCRLEI